MVAQVVQKLVVTHAVPAHTKMKQAKQRAKLAILGRTIQNKDKRLYPAVNHVKKVISAHQRLRLKYALLEHTKMKRANQHAKTAILGRIIQNKDKHLHPAVNHVKKVISVHQRQILKQNAPQIHTKIKQAKQRANNALATKFHHQDQRLAMI